MVGSRTYTAAAGLLVSLAITVVLWWYFDTLAVFLFLPFVPFLFRGDSDELQPERRECPRCGYQTLNTSYEYCPEDGTRLEG